MSVKSLTYGSEGQPGGNLPAEPASSGMTGEMAAPSSIGFCRRDSLTGNQVLTRGPGEWHRSFT
jgi:hypothetical protein